ncbi:unnamed protein product [Linum trigynum]|uniref:Uncharacterized protein n=1 Tax=Linum trigynum TaxID=586398 RepID=A0AAV2DF65_9ROSI
MLVVKRRGRRRCWGWHSSLCRRLLLVPDGEEEEVGDAWGWGGEIDFGFRDSCWLVVVKRRGRRRREQDA